MATKVTLTDERQAVVTAYMHVRTAAELEKRGQNVLVLAWLKTARERVGLALASIDEAIKQRS